MLVAELECKALAEAAGLEETNFLTENLPKQSSYNSSLNDKNKKITSSGKILSWCSDPNRTQHETSQNDVVFRKNQHFY